MRARNGFVYLDIIAALDWIGLVARIASISWFIVSSCCGTDGEHNMSIYTVHRSNCGHVCHCKEYRPLHVLWTVDCRVAVCIYAVKWRIWWWPNPGLHIKLAAISNWLYDIWLLFRSEDNHFADDYAFWHLFLRWLSASYLIWFLDLRPTRNAYLHTKYNAKTLTTCIVSRENTANRLNRVVKLYRSSILFRCVWWCLYIQRLKHT